MTGFVKKLDHAATNRKVYTAEDVAVHYCEAVELKTVPFRMIVGPDGAGLTFFCFRSTALQFSLMKRMFSL